MPIPITLQIPTITRYNKNVILANITENLNIRGSNFNNNSVVYFYTGIDFLTGFSIIPTFVSSTELIIPSVSIPSNDYSVLVYNTVSKLYSNSFAIKVINNSKNTAPTLTTSKFYSSGMNLTGISFNIFSYDPNATDMIFTNSSGYPVQDVSITLRFRHKFTGTNFTPDTVILVRDANNPEKYYSLNNNTTILFNRIFGDRNNQNDESLFRVSANDIVGLPYGEHFIVAVNDFGISNQIPYKLTNTQVGISGTQYNNIENDTHYDYINSTCANITQISGIDGNLYPLEKYGKYLFSNYTPNSVRKREYSIKTSIVSSTALTHRVYVIDSGNTCLGLNCVANDVFPIGAGTSKFTTAQSTIFNTQCPVEVIGLQGTATGGPTPLWDAWKMYSSSGASPAIPICGEQGELTKTYTIEFASKVVAANLDITAQIVSAVSNSMNVTIERWNHLTSTYEVIANNVSTGSWTVGSSITKTIAIPVHTSTYKYRIAMTVLTDTSLNPTHLLKTAKLY